MKYIVSAVAFSAAPRSMSDLKDIKPQCHECATFDCAKQVLSDMITVAQNEVNAGSSVGFTISLTGSAQ